MRIDRRLNDWIPGYSQIRAEAKQKMGAEEEKAAPVYDACLVRFPRHRGGRPDRSTS